MRLFTVSPLLEFFLIRTRFSLESVFRMKKHIESNVSALTIGKQGPAKQPQQRAINKKIPGM